METVLYRNWFYWEPGQNNSSTLCWLHIHQKTGERKTPAVSCCTVEHQHATAWAWAANSRTNCCRQAEAAQSHDTDPETSFSIKTKRHRSQHGGVTPSPWRPQSRTVKVKWIFGEGAFRGGFPSRAGAAPDRCTATTWWTVWGRAAPGPSPRWRWRSRCCHALPCMSSWGSRWWASCRPPQQTCDACWWASCWNARRSLSDREQGRVEWGVVSGLRSDTPILSGRSSVCVFQGHGANAKWRPLCWLSLISGDSRKNILWMGNQQKHVFMDCKGLTSGAVTQNSR